MAQEKTPNCEIIIAGAGLSGLTTAYLLSKQNVDFQIFEASDRPGGRIHSVTSSLHENSQFDLGPTWIWPEYQPVAAKWLDTLGLESFEQFDNGDAIVETNADSDVYRQMLPGQHGIRRIKGGPRAMVNQLLKAFPRSKINLESAIDRVELFEDGVRIHTNNPAQQIIHAKKLIIAVPPRMAHQSINWPAEMAPQLSSMLQITPTWMATQAKAIIEYPHAFWRKSGLSGRIASHSGPLVEVHDHCSFDGKATALFGFVGVPHQGRSELQSRLHKAIIEQLVHCFGELARKPLKLTIQDWAGEPHICSGTDLETSPAHPEVMPGFIRGAHFNERVFFTSAETSARSPGLIEGALDAGERIAARISAQLETGR
ncbi:MAG: FAD-dependent oxidoreductase [Cohaesibacteraceae bacterium]|nr:FAD-dependent oxidoreductase [Cohaesibacteraceae bacterium]MBL4877227.1 FAD-dependent oxidoreductase [Cohaesibacteraceae bacterium]